MNSRIRFLILAAGSLLLAMPAPAATNTLRIMSYNIRRGVGMDSKMDLARTAATIMKYKPDLVALQEVDNRTRRSGAFNQADRLGELTGLHAAFGKAMDYDGGEYGDAILSRFPFQKIAAHLLPADAGHEPRVLVEARVALGHNGPTIVLYNTHLDHQSETERLKQITTIIEITSTSPSPLTFLAGDFNAKPSSAPLLSLTKFWHDAGPVPRIRTYPADGPVERIDYIFYKLNPRLRVLDANVLDEPLVSDHRPVFAVFEIIPETP